MKPLLAASLIAFATSSALHADTADLAIVAAMKLPDAKNYTWSTNVDDDARTYAIDGQADRTSDLSLVTMPMVASVRRRAGTGTANSDNLSTVVFKGDEKFVVQVDAGWKTADELASAAGADSRGGRGGGGYGGYPGGWGGSRGRGRRGMGGGFPSDNSDSDSKGRPTPAYSNLQKTLSRPDEEVGIIVAGASDLKVEGDVVSGTLSDTAAKLLLVHAGQKEITPLQASGTFRLWVKDGVLQKYEIKLEGRLAVEVRGDRHEVDVHQTALTEIKNVGTTKFDVPDEAKRKLGLAVDATPAAKAPTT